jgi:GrpB-like predicted nucleotidyltransferase (UPF0157 family)/GNAT superfamily N-acetyltransferase
MTAPAARQPPGWTDEPIRVEAPRPDWPARFEAERRALADAIGPWATGGIHHVGSTAVPGLDAKPVIDILVGIDDLESGRACFAPLAGLGYVHATYLPDEMHWFCKPDPARRTHHLHLVPAGSPRFADELAFRDHLRGLPGSAASYSELKHRLAAAHPDDREAYTAGKAAFVADALASRTMIGSLGRFNAAQAGSSPGGSVLRRPGLVAGITPASPGRSLVNAVACTDAGALATALPDLDASYRAAGVHAWTVWVPAAETQAKADLAAARHRFDGAPVGMIARLPAAAPPPAAKGLACAEAESAAVLAALNDRGYGLPEGTFAPAIAGMAPPAARVYVGRVAGRPATGCVLVEGDGDANVGLVATLPEHQRQGLASQVLAFALAAAQARGCRTATLQASKAGAPVYARLGFRSLGPLELWERRRPV